MVIPQVPTLVSWYWSWVQIRTTPQALLCGQRLITKDSYTLLSSSRLLVLVTTFIRYMLLVTKKSASQVRLSIQTLRRYVCWVLPHLLLQPLLVVGLITYQSLRWLSMTTPLLLDKQLVPTRKYLRLLSNSIESKLRLVRMHSTLLSKVCRLSLHLQSTILLISHKLSLLLIGNLDLLVFKSSTTAMLYPTT